MLEERPARHEESKRVSAVRSRQRAAGSVRRQRKPLSPLFLALNSTGERGAKFHSKLDARALTHFRFQFFVVEPPSSSSTAAATPTETATAQRRQQLLGSSERRLLSSCCCCCCSLIAVTVTVAGVGVGVAATCTLRRFVRALVACV